MGSMTERSHTVLVYLQNVEQGGETLFPYLNNSVAIQPNHGDAVIFGNLAQNGRCHPDSAHEAAPVRKGEKLILQIWYCTAHTNGFAANCGPSDLDDSDESKPRLSTLCDGVD